MPLALSQPLRHRRSAMIEALADEANATAAQPLTSSTQRAVLIQLLRRWVDAPPSFFNPSPFSKVVIAKGHTSQLWPASHAPFRMPWLLVGRAPETPPAPSLFVQEAPADARAAALLLARVHARLALSRMSSPDVILASAAARNASRHGLLMSEDAGRTVASRTVAEGASAQCDAAGTTALTHGETCKLCWAAKCNTLYAPCGHVRFLPLPPDMRAMS